MRVGLLPEAKSALGSYFGNLDPSVTGQSERAAMVQDARAFMLIQATRSWIQAAAALLGARADRRYA